jgi:hypothetical protein
MNYTHYIHDHGAPTQASQPRRPATQLLAPGTNSGESSKCPPNKPIEFKNPEQKPGEQPRTKVRNGIACANSDKYEEWAKDAADSS